MDNIRGQIRKAMSGFYYVLGEDNILYQTRGRGNFRAKKQMPLVGDYVEFESENTKEGVLTSLLPRVNTLIRPAICNVAHAVIVMSAVNPQFSPALLDRFIVMLEHLSIQPIIYISKMDLIEHDTAEIEQYRSYYQQLGYPVILSSQQLSDLTSLLTNGITVLMGQSGAGKSTLLNTLLPDLALKTAEISDYLGRGKHTTRHVEVYAVDNCLIADTPGFSAIDFIGIEASQLKDYFIEFSKMSNSCKFRECLHIDEPQCTIKKNLSSHSVMTERYQHYLQFYKEIQTKKKQYKKSEG
ncbi:MULTISPECIES: ribosome small subunit-dependent GTPase A [unclassified Granulicatella]|uniref:ribosome small subunit-dependent GTPase A n=1 Tax=unclassified Granulicatella TaxID=2630493 RepID=UPI001074696F|nr:MULTISPECIES: ribosome small subunit-dependent GTPase A [unclassified Granulicatella]MBF0780198.1 ribosome small subunit-dependent GTPase A [Granulicatella sp. 19428wC4_WM01]TFU95691.1 ribosome small subunit-dependent GTPase A [Granulicatella sp. WM01]